KALTGNTGPIAGQASPGATLTYTITLSNSGGSAISGYSLSDAVPANTTFVSASNGGALSAGDVVWSNLSVPAGGTTTVTVAVQVASPIPPGITQIANVTYQTGSTPPACPGPSPQCVVTPTQGNVTMTKALTGNTGPNAGIASPGATLTY